MVAHKKRKYKLGCQEGYFIPTQSYRTLCQPSAFRTPFLDAARLTKEVRIVLTSPGDAWWKTNREWEEFILQAEIAWHAQLVEEQWGLQGVGVHEGLDKDNTLAASRSGIYLPDKPSKFKF
jgi:hypothetical protein